ncbi:mannitol-1-phosphate dehydrogenase [Talaromyces pinophilus]|uniref:Mannitol-1-phosphate dehydrogenase n=1 Tax=Talaromyces pinophilus TaxID=128442 RepID=A0A6V8H780_TALPI|nr:mannitol-1-phosphate dehydrogenase [Talaromyces pinophilus]
MSSSAPIAIPVIDIRGYLSDDKSATTSIISSMSSAAQSPGFLQITGHGIAPELTTRLLDHLKAFFALPIEKKTALHRNNSAALRGFEAVGEQSLEKGVMDSKEGFMIGPDWEPENAKNARFLQGPNQWPAETDVVGLRVVMMDYFREMQALSKTMFRYPPTTPEMSEKSRGIGAHTDFGALTLLLQDTIGGLEVFHRPTETWHPVQPVDGAFVVNIGDMLERWTNNKYTSTLHRVISPVSNQYRYSVAFFNEGLLDQMIECIPTCLEPGQKALYEPVKVEQHLRERQAQNNRYRHMRISMRKPDSAFAQYNGAQSGDPVKEVTIIYDVITSTGVAAGKELLEFLLRSDASTKIAEGAQKVIAVVNESGGDVLVL